MRITLVTDVWLPQVNGLVHTWQRMQQELAGLGHELAVLHPGLFPNRPLPRYPENRLVLRPFRAVRRWMNERRPEAVHIATEGLLGLAARSWCLRRGWPFTSSYHARLTVVLPHYARVPRFAITAFVRWFHGPAATVLAPAASVRDELIEMGLERAAAWGHGVDTQRFQPGPGGIIDHLPRPIFLYVGRVAREKELGRFLDLDLPGSKVVVGDGPALAELQHSYPEVHWLGYRRGEELVQCYNDADVFVFPSRTDTFGMVLLEAGACGLPVAAYPATGPLDVVAPGVSGVLSEDLREAALAALELDPRACRRHAETFHWTDAARQLLDHLVRIPEEAVADAPAVVENR